MKIRTQVTLFSVAGVLLVGGAVIGVWSLAQVTLKQQQQQLVESQAVAIGTNTAEMIAATRSVYTSDLVGQLKPHGVAFKQEPTKGEAPLPAVFVGGIAKKLQQNAGEHGVQFVLRSGWNINKDQGIATDFEKAGWENLLQQGTELKQVEVKERAAKFKPFYRRELDAAGRGSCAS